MTMKDAKDAATIASLILVPVVLAILGNSYTQAVKEREIQAKFVELAIGILNAEPKRETANIRLWAIQVVNLYSGIPFDKEAKRELIERSLPTSQVGALPLNLRTQPGIEGEIVYILAPDTSVRIIREDGEWAFVTTANGQEGWVMKRFLR